MRWNRHKIACPNADSITRFHIVIWYCMAKVYMLMPNQSLKCIISKGSDIGKKFSFLAWIWQISIHSSFYLLRIWGHSHLIPYILIANLLSLRVWPHIHLHICIFATICIFWTWEFLTGQLSLFQNPLSLNKDM